jgi:hypothetical protein
MMMMMPQKRMRWHGISRAGPVAQSGHRSRRSWCCRASGASRTTGAARPYKMARLRWRRLPVRASASTKASSNLAKAVRLRSRACRSASYGAP